MPRNMLSSCQACHTYCSGSTETTGYRRQTRHRNSLARIAALVVLSARIARIAPACRWNLPVEPEHKGYQDRTGLMAAIVVGQRYRERAAVGQAAPTGPLQTGSDHRQSAPVTRVSPRTYSTAAVDYNSRNSCTALHQGIAVDRSAGRPELTLPRMDTSRTYTRPSRIIGTLLFITSNIS